MISHVSRLCFSPGNEYIFIEFFKKKLLVWDRKMRKVVKAIDVELNAKSGNPNYSKHLQFDHETKTALFETAENKVLILNLTNLQANEIEIPDSEIYDYCFIPHQDAVALANKNGISLYNLAGNMIRSIQVERPVENIFTISETMLLVITDDKKIGIIDISTGNYSTVQSPHNSKFTKFLWMFKMQQLFCRTEEGGIFVFSLKDLSFKHPGGNKFSNIVDLLEYNDFTVILKGTNGFELWNIAEDTKVARSNFFLQDNTVIFPLPQQNLILASTNYLGEASIIAFDEKANAIKQFYQSQVPQSFGKVISTSGKCLFAITPEDFFSDKGGESGKILSLDQINQLF
jgi:WD40 repeat protein